MRVEHNKSFACGTSGECAFSQLDRLSMAPQFPAGAFLLLLFKHIHFSMYVSNRANTPLFEIYLKQIESDLCKAFGTIITFQVAHPRWQQLGRIPWRCKSIV